MKSKKNGQIEVYMNNLKELSITINKPNPRIRKHDLSGVSKLLTDKTEYEHLEKVGAKVVEQETRTKNAYLNLAKGLNENTSKAKQSTNVSGGNE